MSDSRSAAKDRDPRLPETSAVGSLPDTQEGRGEGRVSSAARSRHDDVLEAQAIYDEAGASLEVLADLEEQRAIPSVEASDFRASLRRIRDLALRAGAEARSG